MHDSFHVLPARNTANRAAHVGPVPTGRPHVEPAPSGQPHV